MKRLTTALLFVLLALLVQGKLCAQRISLNEKNTPVEKVFQAITQQSGYTYLYPDG